MSLWLLLLWFDFEDRAPGCSDLERKWLLRSGQVRVFNVYIQSKLL